MRIKLLKCPWVVNYQNTPRCFCLFHYVAPFSDTWRAMVHASVNRFDRLRLPHLPVIRCANIFSAFGFSKALCLSASSRPLPWSVPRFLLRFDSVMFFIDFLIEPVKFLTDSPRSNFVLRDFVSGPSDFYCCFGNSVCRGFQARFRG